MGKIADKITGISAAGALGKMHGIQPSIVPVRNAKAQALAAIGKRPDKAQTIRGRNLTIEMVGVPTVNTRRGALDVRVMVREGLTYRGISAKHGYGEEHIRFVNPPTKVPTGEVDREGNRIFEENPSAALDEIIRQAIETIGISDDIKKAKGNTTTIVYPDAGSGVGAADGAVYRYSVNETFAAIIAGAGTGARNTLTTDAVWLVASATTDQFQGNIRLGFGFDASAITGDVIGAATLSLHKKSANTNLGACTAVIVDFDPADAGTYANADYGSFTRTLNSDDSISSSDSNAYFDFALNAHGISRVSGVVSFGVMLGWDYDESFGGSWASAQVSAIDFYHADYAGTTYDPKLTIEHEPAPAGGAGPGQKVAKLIAAGAL